MHLSQFHDVTSRPVSQSHDVTSRPLSGVIFGAGNTAATLAGFISVPATGYLLQVSDDAIVPLASGVWEKRYLQITH